jgi:hypothetical protein
MTRGAALLVALGLLAGAAPAPDTHTIKIKESAPGDVADVTLQTAEETAVQVVDANGKAVVDQKESKVQSYAFRETILERPDPKKRATKLKREYTKAEVKTKDRAQTLPYQGKTVLIEKGRDGKYRFRIEGGKELTGEEATYLEEEFNRGRGDLDMQKLMLPGKPVAVGEVWKIAPTDLLKAWELEQHGLIVDTARTTASGKLLEVQTRNGRQFGKLEFLLEVPLKELSVGNEKAAFQAGSRMTMQLIGETCIDGTVGGGAARATTTMTGTANIPLPDGTQGRMTITSKGTFQHDEKELPRK